MQNYYQLFGVPNFAGLDEIQKAYNRIYAELFTTDSPLSNIPRLKELKDSLDLLLDPVRREEYDAKLREFLAELEKRFDAATQALTEERYQECIDILKECIRSNPREPDFYETIGLAYQLSKRYDDAVKAFQQGLQIVPKSPLFNWYLGDLYRGLRDDDKADTHYLDAADGFKKMLEVDPRNARSLELLADTYAKMKWFDESRDVYMQLVEQYPFKAGYHRDLGGVLYELEDLDTAEEHLLEALRIDATDASALLFLGLVYYRRRLLTLAVQTLESSLDRNPDQPEVAHLIEKIKEVQAEIGRTVEEIIYQPEPDAVVEGTVKWYNIETGMGVLTCPEYSEVLLHFTALQPEDQETLAKGDAVRFGVVKDKMGPVAVQVERLGASSDSDTLPGTIVRYDANLRMGIIKTMGDREIMFPFASLSQDLMEKLEIGQEVLFETKSVIGLSDKPIEQAANIRPRKKKSPPKPP
ncbi:MAG: Cold shock protein CspB [bacterium ADurb.Bin374]|nr:MAG: Cold shock protein CspB [bacterium ADurb.Bin374]